MYFHFISAALLLSGGVWLVSFPKRGMPTARHKFLRIIAILSWILMVPLLLTYPFL